MIIAPVRYSKNEPRVTFYKTGSIIFNIKAIQKFELTFEKRFVFDIEPNKIKLLLQKDGFRFMESYLDRNIFRLNSRQACSKIFELFVNKLSDSNTISFVAEMSKSGNINLLIDDFEQKKANNDNKKRQLNN
jgi:hypothetical protein